MRILLLVGLATGCVETATFKCSFGVTCGADAICDDAHQLCITQEQIDTCSALAPGEICTIDLPNDGVCDGGVCIPTRCGDGFLLGGEICDGDQIGSINNCTQVGYYFDGPLTCKAGCSLDESACHGICGDGVIDEGFEICDGSEPQDTCLDYGFGAGILGCATNCGPAFHDCVTFGWPRHAMPEIPRDVHGSSGTNVWAFGDKGLVQRFDGTNWSDVDVSACITDSQVTTGHVLSPTEAILITEPGAVVVTANGCTAYTITAVGGSNTADIPHVWASSLTDAWAAGPDGLWHFTGSSWVNVDTTAMVAVAGTSATNVWVASQNDVRHYNGSVWSAPAAIAGVDSIYTLWQDENGVYVGGQGPNGAVAKYNAGSGWTDVFVNVPLVSSQSAIAVGAVANGRIFVGGIDFGGSSYAPFLATKAQHGWMLLDAPLGVGHPYAGSDGSITVPVPGSTSVSRFGGATLIETRNAPTNTYSVAVRAEAEAYAVTQGFFAPGDLWAWNGITWSLEADNTAYEPLVANDEVFALISNTVKRRTGPGSWTTVTSINGSVLGGSSASDLFTGNGQSIYHWNGSSSSFQNVGFTVYDIWSASPTVAFAVGGGDGTGNGSIARWNGSTWTVSSIPGGTLATVWGFSPTDVYATGPSTVYHFDGTSWTPIAIQPPDHVNSIRGTASDDLFAATNSGLLHFDGQRWSPVDAGTDYAVLGLGGIGDALYVCTQDRLNILFRTKPW